MASEDKERIVVRFSREEWKRLDDKRHGQETTFQAIGSDLFMQWLHGERGEQMLTSGEFVKCPAHLKDVIHQVINRLSDPVEYAKIMAEGAVREAARLGPQPVPHKKAK